VLLREEEKKAMVEPRRGEVAFGNGLEDMEKDWSSKVRGSPPSSKRNAIRARRRVVPVVDNGTNKIKIGLCTKRVVELLTIPPQKLNPTLFSNRRRPIPNSGPVNFGKGRFFLLRKSRNVLGGKPERRNLGPRLRNHFSKGPQKVGIFPLGRSRSSHKRIARSLLETIRDPTITLKTNQVPKGRMQVKEPTNASVILMGGKHQPEKRQALGKSEVGRGRLTSDKAGHTGRREEGPFKASKGPEGARRGSFPKVPKSYRKSGGLGEPSRNGRTARTPGGLTTERQPHGQVVREVSPLPRGGAHRVVRRVVGDGNSWGKKGVIS
jgi:hypothetical protein